MATVMKTVIVVLILTGLCELTSSGRCEIDEPPELKQTDFLVYDDSYGVSDFTSSSQLEKPLFSPWYAAFAKLKYSHWFVLPVFAFSIFAAVAMCHLYFEGTDRIDELPGSMTAAPRSELPSVRIAL